MRDEVARGRRASEAARAVRVLLEQQGPAQEWVTRFLEGSAAPTHAAAVLLACGPRDLHTLGLEALGVLLAHRGVASRVLGARTPERTLVTAAAATDASAVVVVSHLATQRRPAVDAIRGVAQAGRPTLYAGNASLFPEGRVGVPGTYLGESLGRAADLLVASLTGT